MTDIRWPSGLRGALQAGKQRTRAASFRQSDPSAGAPFFESFADDIPTIWSFQLRFSQSESIVFWDWWRSPEYCDYGRNWFIFPIDTEYGMVEVEGHFTASGIPNASTQQGRVFAYPVELLVREIQYPTNPDFTIPYYERYGGDNSELESLDRAVNWHFPETK